MTGKKWIIAGVVLVGVLGVAWIANVAYRNCWFCTDQTYFARGANFACSEDAGQQSKGLELLQAAAGLEQQDALIALGELYLGAGPDGFIRQFDRLTSCLEDIASADLSKAQTYFKALRKKADPGATNLYDLALLQKNAVLDAAENGQSAEQLFVKAAAAGNPYALYEVGLYYDQKKDYQRSIDFFTRAYQQVNEVNSAIMLGDYHQYGKGVKKNMTEAVSWYRRAQNALKFTPAHVQRDRTRLGRVIDVRLLIAERKLDRPQQNVAIRYRVEGGLTDYHIYEADNPAAPIGRVQKEAGQIQAVFAGQQQPVSSMNEGLKWVLTQYGRQKFGEAMQFQFIPVE